jgi:urease accessory protein
MATMMLALAALAQHVGVTPQTAWHGLQSGLGNPVVGIVPLAAALAAGCLAAAQPKAAVLVAAYVVASVIGASAHIGEQGVPNIDIAVGLSVAALGLLVFRSKPLRRDLAFALLAAAGLVIGYALGAPIARAQRDPILAYLAGLAAIHTALVLAAMYGVRMLAARPAPHLFAVRLFGAFAVGSGAAILLQRYAGGG